jgi:ATP-dependent exoDNAse (exonuclease V) beta subunit
VTALDRIARLGRDLVVQAGAGTGKTHALCTLYLHLCAGLTDERRRLPPSRVAVVTFTDKAAGELKERLRERIGRLSTKPRHENEPTLAAAAAALGVPLADGALWTAALAELAAAPVGTFHSLCATLLRRFAARAGIDPDFTLLDETDARELATEAAERAVLDGLEQNAREVVELVAEYGYHRAGHADRLVESLVRLRAARAEEGRDAAGLGRTYERAALDGEWAEACAAWQAAFARLAPLASELGGKSVERARELCQAAARLTLAPGAGRVADGIVEQLKSLRGAAGALSSVKEEIRAAQDRLVEAEAAYRAAPLGGALARLVGATERAYVAAKRRAGGIDFSDLLVLARDLLRDDQAVRDATHARFDAVLVDEFQDVSPVQAELVDLLCGGRRFVVGDRKQSIYDFRGADVAVFTRYARALVAGGGGEELLRQSRRAVPSLLTFSNALFARVMASDEKEAWALAFDPARDALEPFRPEVDGGGAELLTVAAGDAAESRRREARAIAARILQLRAGGRGWGEMAILLRRFTALDDYLEALRAAQVPHYVVRGRGFYAAQEVRDVASLLTLLDDPDDTLALVAVLRSPLCGVSDETLARLALAGRLGLAALAPGAALSLPADEAARLAELGERLRALTRKADRLGPAACVRALVDGADLTAVLATTREGEQRVANLERLVERARAFEADGGDLRAFASWLRRASTPGAELEAALAQVVDERDDVVRVMTVHQAKGLEFPVVFVPACGGREPVESGAIRYDAEVGLGLRVHDEAGVELVHTTASRRVHQARLARRRAESLRLFYVAATRARDLVVFSGEEVKAAGETWRTHLDRLAADPDRRHLLRVIPEDALPPPPRRKEGVQFPLFGDDGAERLLARVVERPPPAPRAVSAAVTQLADFALCPRRHQLLHTLGLDEHPAAARAASADAPLDEPALDPLRRGTLAHRLLQRCDFTADGLDALLRAEGYDPADPAVADVRADVMRFVATPFARALVGRPLRRELPFLLAVPLPSGGRLLVRGQMDLVLFDAGGVTVLDYKHARAGHPDDYRFQLQAYALAARRLYPDAPAISTGLVFLKESDPTPAIAPAAPGDFEAQLATLGAALAEARASQSFAGRPLEICRQLRCGYVYRCHPEAP